MFIRYFIESDSQNGAINLINRDFQNLDCYIRKKEIKNILPYWKIDNVYIIEVIIDLRADTLKCFMDYYSDKWLECGYPVDEFLTSKNIPECTFIRNGYGMINIFLNSSI